MAATRFLAAVTSAGTDRSDHFGLGLFPFLFQEPGESQERIVDIFDVGAEVDQHHAGDFGLLEVVGLDVGADRRRGRCGAWSH